MKSLYFLTAALAAGALAAPAFAAPEASIGYSSFDVGSSNLNAITLRGGWNGADPAGANGALGFGIEAEAAFGLGDDVSGSGATRSETKLKSELGVFGTVTAGSEAFSVGGRVGVASIDARNVSGTGTTATRTSYSESGLAYGANVAWNLSENNALRLDYTHYDVDLGRVPAAGTTPAVPGHDANAWSLSFVRKFR